MTQTATKGFYKLLIILAAFTQARLFYAEGLTRRVKGFRSVAWLRTGLER